MDKVFAKISTEAGGMYATTTSLLYIQGLVIIHFRERNQPIIVKSELDPGRGGKEEKERRRDAERGRN